MEFKIDTKSNYTIITPTETRLDAKLAEAIAGKCRELTESGSLNYIIDLKNCTESDESGFVLLAELHESLYNEGVSLVLINLVGKAAEQVKALGLHFTLNIAPTLIEAVDVISMEILERDLMAGEDEETEDEETEQ